MYLVLRRNLVFGIFSSKKIAKECINAAIQSDYERTGIHGWYHFRYIKFEPNEPWISKNSDDYNEDIGNALFSLCTMHTEYLKDIENDPNTGEILNF